MKIVTYNVNGLRPRVSQFGSLPGLLDSLDADIICFQETKLSRQDLRADLVRAEGYESFFSCTRTSDKGRSAGYSGVATFCRVKSAISSNEVALPIGAEEGFTGLLKASQGCGSRKDNSSLIAQGLEGFSRDELLKVDSEGRCIITDHGHFVLFNIYGPRAGSDDSERIQFKLIFFKILERRWDCLLRQGRRIVVVGDLNIAPASIDRCDAGPDFEKNEFRKWFRSLLVQSGGSFLDVFRTKFPDRREAYTCWSTSTGAEEFNYGSRIDHILTAGLCLHEEHNQGHDFVTCHVKDCDILVQFRRWKPGNTPRWKGGRSIKLEGSDHAPVYMTLMGIPEVLQHSTPSLSTRYHPQVSGYQQTLVSMLMKRESSNRTEINGGPTSSPDESIIDPSIPQDSPISRLEESYECSSSKDSHMAMHSLGSTANLLPCSESKKRARDSRGSQLTLKSFFQKASSESETLDNNCVVNKHNQKDMSNSLSNLYGDNAAENGNRNTENASAQEVGMLDACNSSDKEKRADALQEWQRIQQFMQNSVPLCRGHKEPCVSRLVKKPGPNLGRRFYVCARAEGPASNPEANCGYFKWAASKPKGKN
ncbi:PREDICTED: DNA-(apurinic or apyrimidinic site) lyase 2 isoform X1 [Ipomoea nil]|uniref:DNA-(apurinic or apyrimidinic site) lyase 2 isoform X1 n=1 Tax=Ipomoea nil TaxID=35883 RepID=UPI00090138A1|nr:PREDICTED: DNA-(apurinic or apyrimidinic site) lyase 2 isoform X1 [Ipomoea nil]